MPAVSPCPSDHRSVVSTFSVVPANAPPVIAIEPARIEQGESFMVRGYLPGSDSFTMLVVPRDAGPARALAGVVDEQKGYRTGIRLGSLELAPGRYDAILVRPSDGSVAARRRCAVVAPGARPQLALTMSATAQGEALRSAGRTRRASASTISASIAPTIPTCREAWSTPTPMR